MATLNSEIVQRTLRASEVKVLITQLCLTLCPARLLCLRNSPGKNTGVGCHSFLQGICLTQRLNLGLLRCRQILYCLSHSEAPGEAQGLVKAVAIVLL